MKRLLWFDLETTGLDPTVDDILMVAAARTDEHGVITDSREWVVSSFMAIPECLDHVVLKMHTESGLLARVNSPEARQLDEVGRELEDFIGQERPILAGNSIHFDRRFITAKLHFIDCLLHYRMLDVSALKVAAQVWGLEEPPKVKKHLALDDIKASIAEFMHWKKEFRR